LDSIIKVLLVVGGDKSGSRGSLVIVKSEASIRILLTNGPLAKTSLAVVGLELAGGVKLTVARLESVTRVHLVVVNVFNKLVVASLAVVS